MEEIKAAIAELRLAEQQDRDADGLKAQIDDLTKKFNDSKAAAAQRIQNAKGAAGAAISKAVGAGKPYTEDGQTVFLVDTNGHFRETSLTWIHGRTAQ